MRQLLLSYFLENRKPLGLAELERAFPKADRITIYRTLKTFEEKGIVHSIENGKHEMKFALCSEHCSPSHHQDDHPHFHCEKCGAITCLESVYVPKMELPKGYILKGVKMNLFGVCEWC
jgi:Fur family ferric uptake transcriptional regulator